MHFPVSYNSLDLQTVAGDSQTHVTSHRPGTKAECEGPSASSQKPKMLVFGSCLRMGNLYSPFCFCLRSISKADKASDRKI